MKKLLKRKYWIIFGLIAVLAILMIAAVPAGGGGGPKTCPIGEEEVVASQWKCHWEKEWYRVRVCHRHGRRLHCHWQWRWKWVKKCHWTEPVCKRPNAPACGDDYFVTQEPVWDAELGQWVGLKCRCNLTGNFEYIYGPAPGSFLRSCTLVTDKAGGGGADVIPIRFLNPVYVNETCSCKDCDGETDLPFVWDGNDPLIIQQNVCQTYLGPLCPPE